MNLPSQITTPPKKNILFNYFIDIDCSFVNGRRIVSSNFVPHSLRDDHQIILKLLHVYTRVITTVCIKFDWIIYSF